MKAQEVTSNEITPRNEYTDIANEKERTLHEIKRALTAVELAGGGYTQGLSQFSALVLDYTFPFMNIVILAHSSELHNRPSPLCVKPEDTVAMLKEMINYTSFSSGVIPLEHQHVTCGERKLDAPDATLADCGVREGSELCLVLQGHYFCDEVVSTGSANASDD